LANRRFTNDPASRYPRGPARRAGLNVLRLQYGIKTDETRDESIGRPFEDVARRTDLLGPPAAQNANPVAERQCFVLVVGDGKERRAKASVQPTYLVAKLLTQPFVESGQWFIEQQHGRLQDERPG